MSHGSMKILRAALYAYSAPVEDSSGIAVSTYTRVKSDDEDGLWWCSRGTTGARETSPTTAAQHVVTAVFGFDVEVPVTKDGVIVLAGEVFRITAVLPRQQSRNEVQVQTVQVDDADSAFLLQEPDDDEEEEEP